jgi:hypothetical protein
MAPFSVPAARSVLASLILWGVNFGQDIQDNRDECNSLPPFLLSRLRIRSGGAISNDPQHCSGFSAEDNGRL